MSLLDFIFFHPVVQLPICIVGGSSAAAYLVQNLVKTGNHFRKTLLHSSIKYNILAGIDYISFYLLIIFIQFSFIWIMQIMSRIRGKKSELSPQQFRWFLSEVDFAFLWAGKIVCLGCPMFEWVTKLNISAGFLSVGWKIFW